ncbi:hypothetical protein MRX96_036861 [Rhipicephalus microplus]
MRRGTASALSSSPSSTHGRWASRTQPVHWHLRRPRVCSKIAARTSEQQLRRGIVHMHFPLDPPGRNGASSAETAFQVERDAPKLVAICTSWRAPIPAKVICPRRSLGEVKEEEGHTQLQGRSSQP